MMEEVEFSVMAPDAEGLRPLLDQFEAEQGVRVCLRLLTWDSAWSTLVRASIYGDAPDVSEIGTTWLGDLVGMNALRPFNTAEVTSFGKAAAFFPAAWKTATQSGDTHVWAIPWLVGSRLLYYRPALLDEAGVDVQTAFRSNASLEEAVRRLAAHGTPVPWTVPTGYTHTTLLNLASWVWAAGGDFLNTAGSAACFSEPAALEGISAYYRLGRFLAPAVRHLNGLEPDDYFLANPNTAMTISGPWLFCRARKQNEAARDGLRIALPPGPPFVGGSNLMIWKHARNPEAAVRLVRFLTQPSAQVAYAQYIGLLPARLEALDSTPFSTDPDWQIAVAGLKSGRSFPTIRLWGLVEDRLTAAFSAMWPAMLADPERDPQPVLAEHLEPLARRLDLLLNQG